MIQAKMSLFCFLFIVYLLTVALLKRGKSNKNIIFLESFNCSFFYFTRKLQKTEKTHILAVFETVRLLYWSVETEIQRHFLFFLIQHFGHFVQKKGNQRTGENVSMEDIEPNLKG
jgi:hypothetical protein